MRTRPLPESSWFRRLERYLQGPEEAHQVPPLLRLDVVGEGRHGVPSQASHEDPVKVPFRDTAFTVRVWADGPSSRPSVPWHFQHCILSKSSRPWECSRVAGTDQTSGPLLA